MDIEFIGLAIVIVILLACLMHKYCKKSTKVDDSDHTACLAENPPPKLKYENSEVSCITYDQKTLTKKEFLHGFVLKFKKSDPYVYDKNLVFSTKYMYQLYLQLHKEVNFPLNPYPYSVFCREIRRTNLSFITTMNGSSPTLELRGYQYTDLL